MEPARRTCSRRCTSVRRASRPAAATTRNWCASGPRRLGSSSRESSAGETSRSSSRSGRARRSGPSSTAPRSARPSSCARRSRRSSSRRTGSSSSRAGPAARRAYFDRALGRLFPARAGVPAGYGVAVAQRNAALRRVTFGASSRDAVEPWTQRVAELGAVLVAARHEVIAALEPPFAERAAELGLAGGRLLYEAEPPTRGGSRGEDRARIFSGARPGSGRIWTMSGSKPTGGTCAATARRESSGWPCSRSCSRRPSC